MPVLGALALSAAALRNYAVTLHAALADTGVYAGSLTIGGLIERGDIYQLVTAQSPGQDPANIKSLDPDEIADAAWRMQVTREAAETVFSG